MVLLHPSFKLQAATFIIAATLTMLYVLAATLNLIYNHIDLTTIEAA